MLIASCHCGTVKVTVPSTPESLADCNCSICRRYGVLWAYYQSEKVQIDAPEGATDEYVWGRKVLAFVRCRTCGCITHWKRIVPVAGSKMGVNARNFDPVVTAGIEIKPLDGASG